MTWCGILAGVFGDFLCGLCVYSRFTYSRISIPGEIRKGLSITALLSSPLIVIFVMVVN